MDSTQVNEVFLSGQKRKLGRKLAFSDVLEPSYQLYHRERQRMPRLACAAGAFLLTATSPLYESLLNAPADFTTRALTVQFTAMLLPIVFAMILHMSDHYKHRTDHILSILIIPICIGMMLERRIGLEYNFHIPFVFPSLIVTFAFVAMRLRFFVFLPAAFLVTVLHCYNELSLSSVADNAIYNVLVIIIMFIYSAASGYNSELRERNSWLNEQILGLRSTLDAQTGLTNKRGFESAFDHALRNARRNQQPLSLVLIDIDHFKAYNEKFGHRQGDNCVKLVSESLSKHAQRGGDVVARLDGEEFAIVWPNTDEKSAQALYSRIQASIAEQKIVHPVSPTEEYLTISAGLVSTIPGPSLSVEDLMNCGYDSLHRAKISGRNCVMTNEAEISIIA